MYHEKIFSAHLDLYLQVYMVVGVNLYIFLLTVSVLYIIMSCIFKPQKHITSCYVIKKRLRKMFEKL